MRLVADSGLWSTGQLAAHPQLTAVLEVSGAVLSWTVDDPSTAAQITFTDPARADWLWRVLGEHGHSALAAALDGRTPDAAVELTGVNVLPESLEPLRRLALGHWLRRWWPASQRDGIAALDGALLDAEIAVLTAGAQDFFTDDTFDSDVAGLLRPHAAALSAYLHGGDPRVIELVRTCAELADDVGVAFGEADARAAAPRRLCARRGPGSGPVRFRRDRHGSRFGQLGRRSRPASSTRPSAPSSGASMSADGFAKAVVRVELSGQGLASGIAVRMRSGDLGGSGVLDADGVATFPLVDGQQQPVTESAAWDHDWRSTAVTVGAEVHGVTADARADPGLRAGATAWACPRRVPGRGSGRRVGLLSVVGVFSSLCIDLRISSSRSAAARWRASYCSSTVRPSGDLGVEFGRADRGAVAGFDLLAHRVERRHTARRVAGVDGLHRSRRVAAAGFRAAARCRPLPRLRRRGPVREWVRPACAHGTSDGLLRRRLQMRRGLRRSGRRQRLYLRRRCRQRNRGAGRACRAGPPATAAPRRMRGQRTASRACPAGSPPRI